MIALASRFAGKHNAPHCAVSRTQQGAAVLFPYNTDAPLYHFPFATIGLIVVNILAFGWEINADEEEIYSWILQFGNGLHPLQWLSCNFLHAGWLHILGNMFYLWGFGLVVEGKLGWWRFLLVYLTIGLIYGAFLQTIMLGADSFESPGALGASGVIFGLMAISLVWAPKNDMHCVLLVGVHPFFLDIPIVGFAVSYLVLQVVVATITGFSMSSEVLHLTGAAIGAAYGVALLKFDIVDCEGWDAFAVWQGKAGAGLLSERSTEALLPPKKEPSTAPPIAEDKARFIANAIKNRLATGDAAGAANVYEKQRAAHPDWKLDEPELMALIKSLHKGQLWSSVLRPMADYAQQFPDRAIKMRLKLAEILITIERRPAKALQVLAKVQPQSLPPELQAIHKKLAVSAEKLRDEGDLEVGDGEDW
jgi:membrane associated rhomboid family serine protease